MRTLWDRAARAREGASIDGDKVVLAFPLNAVTAEMNERQPSLFQTTNKVPKLCLHSPLGRIGYSSNMTVYPRLLRSSVLCVVHTL